MNLFGLHLPERAADSFGSHLASCLPTSISDNPDFLSAVAEEIHRWEEFASEADFLCERVQGKGYAPKLQRSFLQHLLFAHMNQEPEEPVRTA